LAAELVWRVNGPGAASELLWLTNSYFGTNTTNLYTITNTNGTTNINSTLLIKSVKSEDYNKTYLCGSVITPTLASTATLLLLTTSRIFSESYI
jgi:hypothetical protein